MQKKIIVITFLIHIGLIFSLESSASSQTVLEKEVVLYGNNTTGPYKLSDWFILTGSDSIFIAGSLISKEQYQIDYEHGTIVFLTALPLSTQILIHYQSIPFLNLLPSYALHSVELETIFYQEQTIAKERPNQLTFDTTFAGGLEELTVSGSKTLGFSVSSVQGLGIEQATRLNLQGNVAGVEVEAALSDQNSPIPAEGITKEISELDKILINIRTGGWFGSFGDYDLALPFGSFGTVERQVTGAMVIGNLDKAKIQASYSQPKGKYRKIEFLGENGVQGPYRLISNEANVSIVPASEIVYLDGEQLTRGWNEDYTIDYTLAEIIFTNQRIITNQSRIEVNFEYTFDSYDRYDLGVGASYQFSPFIFGLKTFQESDNKNQNFASNLSNADIESLSVIGDDTSRNWLDGGVLVGSKQGDYRKIGGHYVYAGRDSGEYEVTFTLVGDSLGDYVYVESFYVYSGSNQGQYVAKRHIILPQKNEVYLTELGLQMENGLNLNLAGSLSQSDQNLFSLNDDTNNTGFAYTTNLAWKKANYGFSYKRKLTPSKFFNPIRSPDVDFSYNWGDVREEERLSSDEIYGFVKPFHFFSVEGGTGWLTLLNHNTQRRYNLGTKLFWAEYGINKIQKILRQNLNLNPTVKAFFPKLNIFKEEQEISRRLTLLPSLGFKPSQKLEVTVSYDQTQVEKKDTLISNWQRESIRRTYKTDLNTKPFSDLEFNGIFGLQVLESFPGTATGSWQQYFADLSAVYRLIKGITFRIDHHRSNQRTQGQNERYIQVDSGLGDYQRDPETGTFYSDTNGNYKRILEPTGAISRSQEQEWHGSFDFSIFDPLALNTLINFNQQGNDTFVFLRFYNHDARLGIFPFSQNKNFSIYLENSYNYNLDYRYIGQIDWQNQNSVELVASPNSDLNLKSSFEFNLSQQEQTAVLIYRRETERKIIFEPFIGYNLALELAASLSWRNIIYSNYNNFQLITVNFGVKRRWQFHKNTALTAEASVFRRASNINKLPFGINLSDPLGFTPEFNLNFEQIISKELVFSASYYFQDRPDRVAEQSLSANFRAYF